MKIRGKLLTLILIPLLALSAAAVWGFRDQTVKTEQAQDARDLAVESAAVHRVVIALGDERLALYSDLTAGELEALRSETDEALVEAGLTPGAVQTARAQTERIAGADRYTDAIGQLLDINNPLAVDSSAADVFTADQLLTNIAAKSSYAVLEVRETAWFDYIETSEIITDGAETLSLVPVAVSLSEASTLASEANKFIDQQAEPQLKIASDSPAEQFMANLAFLATNEMATGASDIARAEIVEGLSDARAEWNEALIAADSFLIDATQRDLDDANGIRTLFTLLGVVGMLIFAGLVFVIHRSITAPLQSLVASARTVAQDELPALIRTLRSEGELEALPVPAAIPAANDDEIGQLVAAFNEVRFTAHELATEQALGRRNVAEMFVNLGRRNQQLLQRILGLLTDLERDEEDPDTLRDLFVLDNVVTRMRRNAESLLVLAGGQTPRQWSDPVSLEDTIRSALSEVENYERIDIAALAEVRIPGNVVADIAHLLAELIENAVSFSDPSTKVLIGGHFENDGYLVTIFDQGIGMSDEQIEDSNARIIDPPSLDQAPTKYLGLFVVGRLADRHGIRVRLAKAPGRGVMARVLVPNATLIVDEAVDTTPTSSTEVPAFEERRAPAEFVLERPVIEPPAPAPAAHFGDTSHDVVEAEAAPLGADLQDLDQALAEVGTDELPKRHVPAAPAEPAPPTTLIGDLPVRVRGSALGEEPAPQAPQAPPAPKPPQAEQPEELGEAAAGSFSSMMSAFSTGVNRGLEETAFDSIDEGNDQ